MRSVFDKMSQYALLRAALYIVLGVLLVFAPETVMHAIVYILAGYIAFMGLVSIIGYFRGRKNDVSSNFEFIGGVLLIVLAAILLIFSKYIISVLPVFFGVLVILSGASYLLQALSVKKNGFKNSALLIVLAVLFIAAGLIMIFKPFTSLIVLFKVFGVTLAVLGVSEIVTFFLFNNKDKTGGAAPQV